MSHRLTVLAATLVIALFGCGGAEGGPAPSVVLGTGEASFEPIEGEPMLRLVAGAQGGWHVWASFLAYGYDEERLDVVLTTTWVDRLDSRLVMRANLSTRPGQDADGEPMRSFAGYPAQIDNARCAHGERVLIELSVTDSSGRRAEDSRYCIADVPEGSRASACPN